MSQSTIEWARLRLPDQEAPESLPFQKQRGRRSTHLVAPEPLVDKPATGGISHALQPFFEKGLTAADADGHVFWGGKGRSFRAYGANHRPEDVQWVLGKGPIRPGFQSAASCGTKGCIAVGHLALTKWSGGRRPPSLYYAARATATETLSIPCAGCGAPAGVGCRDDDGAPRVAMHTTRRRQAEIAVGKAGKFRRAAMSETCPNPS